MATTTNNNDSSDDETNKYHDVLYDDGSVMVKRVGYSTFALRFTNYDYEVEFDDIRKSRDDDREFEFRNGTTTLGYFDPDRFSTGVSGVLKALTATL